MTEPNGMNVPNKNEPGTLPADDERERLRQEFQCCLSAALETEPNSRERYTATATALDILAQVDDAVVAEVWQAELCTRLNLKRRPVAAEVKKRRQAFDRVLSAGEVGEFWGDGGAIWQRYKGLSRPLTNFEARIMNNVRLDRGGEYRAPEDGRFHWLELGGRLQDAKALPTIRVPAKEFADMKWVIPMWGAECIVRNGVHRDLLRTAIQQISLEEGIGERVVYAHSGWRTVDGQPVFFCPNGVAIGPEGIVPDVEVDMSEVTSLGHVGRYGLPAKWSVTAEDIRLSLDNLELAADRISFPVLAVVVGAPLMPFNELSFVVGLSGTTGKGKTAYVTRILSHFAHPKPFDYLHAPANFQSTITALERNAFLLQHYPLLVDDLFPSNVRKLEEMPTLAERLIRAVGDRHGRARGTIEGKAGLVNTARCAMLMTGEFTLLTAESTAARLVEIEVLAGDIKLEALIERQPEAVRFAPVMADYIHWLARRYADLGDVTARIRTEARQKFKVEGMHERLRNAAAALYTSLSLYLDFAQARGAITPVEAHTYLARCASALFEVLAARGAVVAQAKVHELFVDTLLQLLAAEHVRIAVEGGQHYCGGANGELVGYIDKSLLSLDLLPSVRGVVRQQLQKEGRPLPHAWGDIV